MINKKHLIFSAIGFILASLNISKGWEIHRSLKTIGQVEDRIRKTAFISPGRIYELQEELQVLNSLDSAIKEPAVYESLATSPYTIDDATDGQTSFTGIIHRIRILLKNNSIQSSQFRIINDPLGETVEFILHSSPDNFFNFLSDISNMRAIDINYLNIKPEPGSLAITIRIKHET